MFAFRVVSPILHPIAAAAGDELLVDLGDATLSVIRGDALVRSGFANVGALGEHLEAGVIVGLTPSDATCLRSLLSQSRAARRDADADRVRARPVA